MLAVDSSAAELTVRPVRNGRGLVAERMFRRGGLIVAIAGRIVAAERVWRYWNWNPRRAQNCFRYDADNYLDPHGQLGAFANHSCAPNAGVIIRTGRMFLKAIRSIAAGEEITHDYSTLLGADDAWTMACNCGEANCRRLIASYPSLSAGVRREYERLGIVPRFILDTRPS